MIEQSLFRNIELFSGLSDTTLEKLACLAKGLHYPGGQIIMQEGDDNAAVFFVLSGSVRIYHTNLEGKEQTIIYIKSGDCFNFPIVFSKKHTAPASATALDVAEVLAISQVDFRKTATENPDLSLAVMQNLSEKLVHLNSVVYDLGLRSVRGRLANFLLKQSTPDGNLPPKSWTQEEIALHIGSAREVVSRTLRVFIQEGLITKNRHQIVLLDARRLEEEIES